MTKRKVPQNKRAGNKQARYMKYAGLAFQLFFIFAIVVFFGKKIDAYLGNEKMYITMFLIVVSFVGIMYRIMKDLERD